MFRTLMEFYLKTSLNKLIMLGILLVFWPGLMFVVGFIGESRLVPIWEHQSKAFFPGDLTLPIMLLALFGLHQRTYLDPSWKGYESWIFIGIFLAMIPIALIFRHLDAAHYPGIAMMSPTKIVHDFIGYYLFPAVLISLGLPQLIDCIAKKDWRSLPNWIIFGLALAFYIVCTLYDIYHPATAEDVIARHPMDWKPIWK